MNEHLKAWEVIINENRAQKKENVNLLEEGDNLVFPYNNKIATVIECLGSLYLLNKLKCPLFIFFPLDKYEVFCSLIAETVILNS